MESGYFNFRMQTSSDMFSREKTTCRNDYEDVGEVEIVIYGSSLQEWNRAQAWQLGWCKTSGPNEEEGDHAVEQLGKGNRRRDVVD